MTHGKEVLPGVWLRSVRVTLPLLGGIVVNPEGPLGRRLCARNDQLSRERAALIREERAHIRRVAAEWASYH